MEERSQSAVVDGLLMTNGIWIGINYGFMLMAAAFEEREYDAKMTFLIIIGVVAVTASYFTPPSFLLRVFGFWVTFFLRLCLCVTTLLVPYFGRPSPPFLIAFFLLWFLPAAFAVVQVLYTRRRLAAQ